MAFKKNIYKILIWKMSKTRLHKLKYKLLSISSYFIHTNFTNTFLYNYRRIKNRTFLRIFALIIHLYDGISQIILV